MEFNNAIIPGVVSPQIGPQGGSTSDAVGAAGAMYGGPSGIPPKADRLMVQSQTAWRDINKMSVYDFIEHTYVGSHGYSDGYYLIPHPREAYYENRRLNAYYINVFKEVIQAMTNRVFSDIIPRVCDNEQFTAFIDNCDDCGTPLQNMVESTMLYARMHDLAFIIMDNYRIDEMPTTFAEALQERKFPYIYMKRAQDVYKWSTTHSGQLQSIDFYDEKRIEKINDEDVYYQTYRHWQIGSWYLYRVKKSDDGKTDITVILEEGALNIKKLPVIAVLDFAKTNNMQVLPITTTMGDRPSNFDLAKLCFALFNKESEMRNLEQLQGFCIFYSQGIDQQSMTISPGNLWVIPETAKIPPGIISPNPEHLKNALESCERMKSAIRECAGQKGVLVSQPRAASSGISKEWDFIGEETVLKRTAIAAKNLELAIADLYKEYTGANFSFDPRYPQKFDPGINDKLAGDMMQMYQNSPSKPLAQEIEVYFAGRWFGTDTDTGNDLQERIAADSKFQGDGAIPAAAELKA